jgi:hypothetical protein
MNAGYRLENEVVHEAHAFDGHRAETICRRASRRTKARDAGPGIDCRLDFHGVGAHPDARENEVERMSAGGLEDQIDDRCEITGAGREAINGDKTRADLLRQRLNPAVQRDAKVTVRGLLTSQDSRRARSDRIPDGFLARNLIRDSRSQIDAALSDRGRGRAGLCARPCLRVESRYERGRHKQGLAVRHLDRARHDRGKVVGSDQYRRAGEDVVARLRRRISEIALKTERTRHRGIDGGRCF